MTRTLQGTAPDGSTVTIVSDPRRPDSEMCTAEDTSQGGTWHPECTLPYDHPGPWHIADTGYKIIAVWPVNPS